MNHAKWARTPGLSHTARLDHIAGRFQQIEDGDPTNNEEVAKLLQHVTQITSETWQVICELRAEVARLKGELGRLSVDVHQPVRPAQALMDEAERIASGRYEKTAVGDI